MQCPVCHGDNSILVERRMYLYKCDQCLHTFTVLPTKGAEYTDDYYEKTHKDWFDNPDYRLFDFIHKETLRILVGEQVRLLDVGCGKGDFLKYVAADNSTAELSGIDLTYNEHPRIHFMKGDFLEHDLETKFNVVCSLAVIEHVNDPNSFVAKLHKILRPGGLGFIMTVNNNSLIYRVTRLLNRMGVRTAHDRLYSFHHVQHFTNKSLRILVEKNGFDVLLLKNYNNPLKATDVPADNIIVRGIYKLAVLLLFGLSFPFGAGVLQIVVCKKR